MAINVKCPFCGNATQTRTSWQTGILSLQASVYCPKCGGLKADFVGQLINVKRAVFVDAPETAKWDKTEQELQAENRLPKISNEERLACIRNGEKQPDLFKPKQAEEKPDLTPQARVERRKKLQNR
ncbi:hypothetical protein RO21_11285 [[Actinobacillus] muris]|uniref:Uncharacterized protein n=1 Tax=Muribacter muris TaxID=67855 RepID=A0A0J5P2N0_9PAST|nr:hypothetical protein [Muribacter muris]KMK50516.1 hypothetical protein RO21_11285 [[Actinobacillus] muris] [Muribacter muris]